MLRGFGRFGFWQIAPIVLGVCLLAGCEQDAHEHEADPEQVYARLAPADREWLQAHDSTREGYLGWVVDELHIHDDGYRYWVSSDDLLHIENPDNGRNLEVNITKMWRQSRDVPGHEKAEELLAQAHRMLGPPPKNSGQRMLAHSPVPDGDRAQELRYPELYKELMRRDTERTLQDLRGYIYLADGDESVRREVSQALQRIFWERSQTFGAAHPSLREPSQLHEMITKHPLRIAEVDGGTTVVMITVEEAINWPFGQIRPYSSTSTTDEERDVQTASNR
ncbi:hypothetical protein KQI84_11895 [bacterium]|nr:hypothetical protein [bacterium]